MIYNRPYSVVFARLLACCHDIILIRFICRLQLAYAGGSRAQRKFQLSPRARFFASSTESVEFWQDLIEVTTIVEFRNPADMFSDLRYS